MRFRLDPAIKTLALAGPALLANKAYAADFSFGLEASFRNALESGSWGTALGLIYLAGLATALTPCVYPMIAITVSVFGARQAKSRTEGALLSTCFVLGIAALFTPLGVVVGMTGGVFGSQLGHPAVMIGLALLFTALALSMFGAFELTLPASVQNRLAQVGGVGYRGAFGLGLVSAIVAAPCTGPVLAALLTWIGASGNAAFGGAALAAYALGLGTLFWIVGTFAVSLPKTGRWVESVKSGFGIVMLVLAMYYVRALLPYTGPETKDTTYLAVALVLLVAGVALGAVHLSYHGASVLARIRKTLGIALAVVGAMGALYWNAALPPGAKIEWMADYESARTLAQADGRPLLVDFGASWCTACEELDKETFAHPRVVAAARDRGFVPVRIDLSPGEDTEEKRAVLASYNQQGLPLVVLHDREGEEVARVTGFVDASEFLDILDRVD